METIKAKNHSGPNPAQNVASPVEPIQNSEPEEASKREPHYLKRIMNFISLKGKPHETGSPDAPETFSAEEG